MKRRVIVTTLPFGAIDGRPLDLLKRSGVEVVLNPLGRRLKEGEVASVISGFPVVIAGTETISEQAMAACPDVKAICRVGIGLDSVDLLAAQRRGIAVSYTPDGPSAAVAELTVGLIIDLLRGVSQADRRMRAGEWSRYSGGRIARSTIGVVGVGRIGRRVIRHLQGGFAGVRILANDPVTDPTIDDVTWADKETLYRESDVVTLHVPLTAETHDLITERELALMKPAASIVNTSRGGIVNERDLASALSRRAIKSAAMDVFVEEPYEGPLCEIDDIVLTSHMGSMTDDCRARMEVEAVEDALRFLAGEPFKSPVPEAEYINASKRNGH